METARSWLEAKKPYLGELEPLLQSWDLASRSPAPVGARTSAQLANQIIVACNIAAMGKHSFLATRAGLDPNHRPQRHQRGLAGVTVLNAKAPIVISRNFKPAVFRIRLPQKDLRTPCRLPNI